MPSLPCARSGPFPPGTGMGAGASTGREGAGAEGAGASVDTGSGTERAGTEPEGGRGPAGVSSEAGSSVRAAVDGFDPAAAVFAYAAGCSSEEADAGADAGEEGETGRDAATEEDAETGEDAATGADGAVRAAPAALPAEAAPAVVTRAGFAGVTTNRAAVVVGTDPVAVDDTADGDPAGSGPGTDVDGAEAAGITGAAPAPPAAAAAAARAAAPLASRGSGWEVGLSPQRKTPVWVVGSTGAGGTMREVLGQRGDWRGEYSSGSAGRAPSPS